MLLDVWTKHLTHYIIQNCWNLQTSTFNRRVQDRFLWGASEWTTKHHNGLILQNFLEFAGGF